MSGSPGALVVHERRRGLRNRAGPGDPNTRPARPRCEASPSNTKGYVLALSQASAFRGRSDSTVRTTAGGALAAARAANTSGYGALDRGSHKLFLVAQENASGDEPRFSPVIALMAVSAMWEAQLSATLKDIGITTRKFGLLGHIYAEPGISFSELARRSHITVQSAHTAVRSLVDDGLVADAMAHAGAASDLTVTPKGERVLNEAREQLIRLDEALAARLPKVAASLDGIRAGIV